MEEAGGRYPTPHKGYQPPSQDYLNAQNFYQTTTSTSPPPVTEEISYKSEKPVSMYSFSFTTTTEKSKEYYGQLSLIKSRMNPVFRL